MIITLFNLGNAHGNHSVKVFSMENPITLGEGTMNNISLLSVMVGLPVINYLILIKLYYFCINTTLIFFLWSLIVSSKFSFSFWVLRIQELFSKEDMLALTVWKFIAQKRRTCTTLQIMHGDIRSDFFHLICFLFNGVQLYM